MDDWPERYGAALQVALTEDEIETILALARDVAHATERRFAPLTAYLTGKFVARRQADGTSAEEALREAEGIVGRLLRQ